MLSSLFMIGGKFSHLYAIKSYCRRGTIAAHSIVASIGKNCDDCAQFAAQQLQLNVIGRAGVEEDSIWACTWVEVEVGTDLLIAGYYSLRLNYTRLQVK